MQTVLGYIFYDHTVHYPIAVASLMFPDHSLFKIYEKGVIQLHH